MKPALAAVVAKVRADSSWPDLSKFASLLHMAGATEGEVISMTLSYRATLLSGHWPDVLAPSAEDEVMASLRSFSLEQH